MPAPSEENADESADLLQEHAIAPEDHTLDNGSTPGYVEDSFTSTVTLLATIHKSEVQSLKLEIDRLSRLATSMSDSREFAKPHSFTQETTRQCIDSPQRIRQSSSMFDPPHECTEIEAPKYEMGTKASGPHPNVGEVTSLPKPKAAFMGQSMSEISLDETPSVPPEESTFELLKAPQRGSMLSMVEDEEPKLTRQVIGMQTIPINIQNQPEANNNRRTATLSTLLMVTDTIVAMTIVLNAIAIGAQTDYMARHLIESTPVYDNFELCFCAIFTSELIIRLMTYRISFFTMRGRHWNMFDAILVIIQWVDVLGLLFLGQLTVVTDAIYNSMLDLLTTAAILLLLVYCFGVVFTHAVSNHRMNIPNDGESENADLQYWWGNLYRSMISLLESVLDGADWDNALSPLLEISDALGLLFLAYIAFAMLAMLNVITGIFVQSALRNAEKSKDSFFLAHVRQLFSMLDQGQTGQISRTQYMASMDSQELQRHMNEMDIDPREAKLLFNYIDSDNSNTISCEELLEGLLRLRAGAKFMDLMSLMHEFELQRRRWGKWSERVEGLVLEIGVLIKEHMK